MKRRKRKQNSSFSFPLLPKGIHPKREAREETYPLSYAIIAATKARKTSNG